MTRRELIEYCLTYAGAYEDYPFDEGEWTVMRHRGNKKSFALIYERNGNLCLNVKCEPMRAEFYRKIFSWVTPAYHMNKIHWNTVTFQDGIDLDEVYEMISHSYELIKPKGKKANGS